MLKPIPASILRSEATVRVCCALDKYQNQVYAEYVVRRVHIQPTNEIRKTADNTECTLRAILFVDARISKPALDWCALLQAAHDLGGDMRVIIREETYTVMAIDALRGDTDRLHHYEIALV